jgi:putative intracellular protease/amidase
LDQKWSGDLMNKAHIQHTTLILTSSGFDEESTIKCIKQLRGSGLEAKLVGLRAGLLVGAHGLTVRPDITLGGLDTQRGYRLIVVPGSAQSARSLLADPRVHRLFTVTTKAGGWVAVMNTAEEAFVQAGLLDLLAEDSVMVQGGQDTADFINKLVHLAVA